MGMYELLYTIAIVSIVAYMFYAWYNPKLAYVRSKIDNKIYVVRNLENKEDAADVLAKVSKRLNSVVEKFIKKYGESDDRVNLLVKRFRKHEIREAFPAMNSTSYSINKGERIVLCIR